ncbi:MAG: ArsR/SmtB family transcription factor [Acidobacteriota bacterium]
MARTALSLVVDRFKALAHPARLRMMAMLGLGDLCVCQLTAILRLAPSTVSAHLAALRRGGLVGERKVGRWVYYHLEPEGERLLAQLREELTADPQIAQDAALVGKLRSIDPQVLCDADLDLSRVGLLSPQLKR